MVRVVIFLFLLSAIGGVAGAETTTSVGSSMNTSSDPHSCPDRPSGDEVQRILTTGMFCGPMVLAVGAKYLPASHAATFAALTRGVGKLGGRIIAGMNISGGILGAIAVAAAFGRGANSIEMCRVEGMDLKRYIIAEVEKRGEQIEKNLEAAGFKLTDVEKRRLRFRPSYHDKDYLERRLCGEVVMHAEYMKERQNRVYLERTSGTMKNVPFPPEPKEGLSEQDKQEIAEYLKSLQCLPAERYVQGICAIGSFVLFRKALKEPEAPIAAVRSDLKTTSRAIAPARTTTPLLSAEAPGVNAPLTQTLTSRNTAQKAMATSSAVRRGRRRASRQNQASRTTTTSNVPNSNTSPDATRGQRQTSRQSGPVDSTAVAKVTQASSQPPGRRHRNNKPLAYSQKTTTPLKPLSGRTPSPQEQILKTAVFQSDQALPQGLTGSRLVTLTNGQQAVWKPHRESIDSNYRAEVFAYEFDQKLKLGLVPPTVEHRRGDQVGSLQLFVNGKDALERRVSDPHQEFKQSFFDYLIDHRDRHRHNFLTTDEGRFVSIDNTDSMTGRHGLRGRSFDDRMVELHVFMGSQEGRQVVQRLKQTRNPQFRKEVEDYFGKEDTDKFMQRIDKVIEHFDAMIGH